jgi:hypothetical protein
MLKTSKGIARAVRDWKASLILPQLVAAPLGAGGPPAGPPPGGGAAPAAAVPANPPAQPIPVAFVNPATDTMKATRAKRASDALSEYEDKKRVREAVPLAPPAPVAAAAIVGST